ncbi:MAG: 30S ribosomal protein S13 [Candidatus Kerfeldbacteria bacterium]|nr:30S ribosomal protein S13 [Candidatus Kerfeldbacteria bacterium]
MAVLRLSGVTLPATKRIEIAMSYLYGVGVPASKKILAQAEITDNPKVADLTDAQISKLRDIIEKHYKVEGDLKREVLLNIKRLKEIGAYRGVRHSRNLPVRGQRTKTNSRTVRGNVRRTMGSGRKPAAEKT